jgi:hypothetical protein
VRDLRSAVRAADLAARLDWLSLPQPGSGVAVFDTAPCDLDTGAVAVVGWDLAARIGADIR